MGSTSRMLQVVIMGAHDMATVCCKMSLETRFHVVWGQEGGALIGMGEVHTELGGQLLLHTSLVEPPLVTTQPGSQRLTCSTIGCPSFCHCAKNTQTKGSLWEERIYFPYRYSPSLKEVEAGTGRVCALPSIQEALGSGTATQTRYGGARLAPQTGRGRIEYKVGTSHTGRWGQQGLRETLRQKRRTVK